MSVTTPTAPRVLVLSASMGGGHDGAANELAGRLRARGQDVEVRDYLAALPLGFGWIIRWVYLRQLTLAPASYDALYRGLERHHSMLGISRGIAYLACPRLRRWTRGYDRVVATYPLAAQALGRMRRRGTLEVPFAVYLTDFSAHPLWVTAEADEHLVLHDVTAAQVRALEPTARVRVGGALVKPAFASSCTQTRAQTRSELGIPDGAVMALIVAGSWGVGDVTSTARELAACAGVHPVVVCGRNDALRTQLNAVGVTSALGWVADMPRLLQATDVLVQNAGGLTSLEALAAGVPVVSYGCLAGHGRANSAAMEQAGVALHACRLGSLGSALDLLPRSYRAPDGDHLFSRDPTDAVASLRSFGSVVAAARARRQHMRRRVLAGITACTAGFGIATTGVSYAANRGVGVIQPAAQDKASAVFLVVRDTQGTLSDAQLASLATSGAALAVAPKNASHLAAASAVLQIPVLLASPGTYPSHVSADPQATDDGLSHIVLLHHRTNALELGRTYLHDASGLVPNLVMRDLDDLHSLHGGEVVVLDAATIGAGHLDAALSTFVDNAHDQGFTIASVSTMRGARL